MSNYDDIINLPHHQSTKHPHMSMRDRAAQFSPFAALTGYDKVLAEAEREEKTELTEEERNVLNEKLNYIAGTDNPNVTITCFDSEKITGDVRLLDTFEHKLILTDGTEIMIDDIVTIEVE